MNEIVPTHTIGDYVPLVDGPEKVSGRAKYTADFVGLGMLAGRIFRSPYSHAEILDVDVSEAEKLPGVKAVVTGADCDKGFGVLPIARTEHPLARERVRYCGEPVAAVAAIDDATAKDLEDTALAFGLDVLLEVHDETELQRALGLRSTLIGINNRNLMTFETTLATSERLAPLVPRDHAVVGESGLATPADLARLAAVGISAFLIGESLMRAANVEDATRSLLTPSAPWLRTRTPR